MDLAEDTNFLGAAISHLSGAGELKYENIDAVHKHVLSWVNIPDEKTLAENRSYSTAKKYGGFTVYAQTLTGKLISIGNNSSKDTVSAIHQKIEKKGLFGSIFSTKFTGNGKDGKTTTQS